MLPLALLGAACAPDGLAATPGAPLVIVSLDTLRSDRVGAYGGSVETPALDGLASDGVLFERAYSHTPLTLPSHATLMTGLLPPGHGVRNNKGYGLDPGLETLAERLSGAGYRTQAAVSSEVLARRTGIDQGFDGFEETWAAPGPDANVFAQARGDLAVARAREWLETLEPGAPFFLFVHLFDPHTPYEAPEPWAARYEHPYDAEVAWTDQLVGELLEALRSRGLYDGALIVVLSDHGEGLGEHGEEEHGIFLYRESLQVPLLLKLPGGRRAGERVSRAVGLVDVAPTLLGALGLEAGELPGLPLLAGGSDAGERGLYGESRFGLEQYGWAELRSAIVGDLHYIHAPRPELYDLAEDPEERHNLLPGRGVPRLAQETILAAGEGRSVRRAVSREEEERLASLGYLGGPVEEAGPEGEARPDPKDHVREAMELNALLHEIGRGGSLAAERRVVELLERLGAVREPLRRAVATNLLSAGLAAGAERVLRPVARSPDASTQLLLGETAVALGRLDEARARFGAVIEREPERADAQRDMGILLLSEGRFRAATPWLERAVELDPGQSGAWNGLGVARAQQGDTAGAVRAWREAVARDPALADAWFNLALTLRSRGESGAAADALRRYLPLVSGEERARGQALLRELAGAS